MGGIFDVTQRLLNLGPRELASMVRRALQIEANRLNLPYGSSRVTQRVNVGDEGEDGVLLDVPAGLKTRLPTGRSLLQLKTTAATGDVKTELVKEVEKKRPREILEDGGTYILVWNKDAVGTEADDVSGALKAAVGDKHKDQVMVWSVGVIEELCLTNPSLLIELGLVQGLGVYPFSVWAPGLQEEIPNYVPDDERQAAITQIRRAILETTDTRIVHVQGDAGVGKTRLIREALDTDAIRDQVVVGDADSVFEFIRYIAMQQAHCILFADEAGPAEIDRLEKAILPAQGRIRLITAGLPGPSRWAKPAGNDIHLGRLDTEAMQKLISEEAGLPESQTRWVAEVSEGYPRLAIEVAKWLRTDPDAASIGGAITAQNIQQILDRMLSGDDLQEHLGIAALFSSIGIEGDREGELRAVAHGFGIDFGKLRQALVEEEDRFVSRAGSLRSVTPRLVAVWLASLLLRNRGAAVAEQIRKLPEPLPGRFRDQLVYLREAPLIREIVSELLKQPEFRSPPDCDEAAAGFLRAAAAVDPEQVAKLLEDLIGELSDEQLQSDELPRRDVVWTLEQLLWPEETYETAASLLLLLAENETEAFANNATGVLVDSFQTYLGGTRVSYGDRLRWLDRNAKEMTDTRRKILAACAAAGLRHHQTRMHGFRPDEPAPNDWRPQTVGEEADALRGAWERLVRFLPEAFGEVRDEIFEHLVNAIRSATTHYLAEEVLVALQDGDWSPDERAKLVAPLRDVLKYDEPDDEWRDRIQASIAALVGDTFEERLGIIFRTPIYDLHEDDQWREAPGPVKALAAQAAADDSKIDHALRATTELRDENTAYTFWGEVAGQADPKQLAERALTHDPPVLAAYQAALRAAQESDPDWVDGELAACVEDARRASRLVQLVQATGLTDKRADLLLDAAESGAVPAESLAQLLYGASVRLLDPERALRVVRAAAAAGTAVALEHALGILHQYTDADPHFLERKDVQGVALELGKAAFAKKGNRSMTSHYAYELAKGLPVADALAILETRIVNERTLPDPPEIELLNRCFSEEPGPAAEWAKDLLHRAASPPVDTWALWAESLHLLTRIANAIGGDETWDWFRQQDEDTQMMLIRHIDFGLAEPDALVKNLLEHGDERLLNEVAVGFSNSLGTVVGPYHLGLQRQVDRMKAWRAELAGHARKWADEQVTYYEQRVSHQRKQDLEEDALFRS